MYFRSQTELHIIESSIWFSEKKIIIVNEIYNKVFTVQIIYERNGKN